MTVATNNPMRIGTQRRATGVRRQRANNPLRRPANVSNQQLADLTQQVAEQSEIANTKAAAIDRTFQSMSNSTAETSAEAVADWRKPRPNQTQDERNAEIAEMNRMERKATEWA